MRSLGRVGRAARRVGRRIWPTQKLRWTLEGFAYFFCWVVLLLAGLNQQLNLILLVSGLAAGPLVASVVMSAAMLRRIRASRRVAPYVFEGDVLTIDYTLENERRHSAALALIVADDLAPADRLRSGAGNLPAPRAFFARVPGLGRERIRWQGNSPTRGRYQFRTIEIATRSPFGLCERRVTFDDPAPLLVYPQVGQLSRRWHLMQRQALETRRGQRHDRSAQQQEYHGLRDYRAGDSPRWIHWRTSARVGKPMIKEFEQQNEQDVAILLDPWLPRTKISPEQREAVELAIRFAATVCLETCRHQGHRILLGWTGPIPGVCQGPASVKLLHELLEQLAVMKSTSEASLSALLDALPPATLRESVLVIVTTRPINLLEEAERSARLSGAAARGLLGRVVLLDASRGDLAAFIQFTADSSTAATQRRNPQAAPSTTDAPGRPRSGASAGSERDCADPSGVPGASRS
jgi:uncharacterized protein (DUF58 family)